MKDPYAVLGVERTADDKAIQSAYRKLAKTLHPDVNPGKPEAAERFKELSAAYALLSDAEKRARFDRGEIDASGAERPPERRFYQDFGGAAGQQRYQPHNEFGDEDLADLFTRAFGKRGRSGFAAKGEDRHYTLSVNFLEAARGATKRISLPDGRTLDVAIPEGIRDKQVLRLKGKGEPGVGGDPAGDAMIEVSVTPHNMFRREGNDIHIELPVTIKEAVLGAKVQVPTIEGTVTLTIPPNASTGMRLRLKGRGIAGGHQYVDLKIVLPPDADPDLVRFLESWQPEKQFDPRRGMGGA
jgi:DnaJ-class molecular chaperone